MYAGLFYCEELGITIAELMDGEASEDKKCSHL